jgi:Novel toxin 10
MVWMQSSINQRTNLLDVLYRKMTYPMCDYGCNCARRRPVFVCIGGGLTEGGVREFVIPNGPIPPNSTISIVR